MVKVLVVDDDRALQALLKEALEDDGFQVSLASNGEIALALLPLIEPDVILCDILMPVMDGIELCEYVLTHPEYATIPFILFSEDVQPSGRRCPATAFLPKPFSLETLKRLIQILYRLKGRN